MANLNDRSNFQKVQIALELSPAFVRCARLKRGVKSWRGVWDLTASLNRAIVEKEVPLSDRVFDFVCSRDRVCVRDVYVGLSADPGKVSNCLVRKCSRMIDQKPTAQ